MASVNKVILVGHLGADPEIRSFPTGGRIANFRMATSESWTDKATNARKERTEWHSIVVDNDNLVQVVERFLKKGSQLFVEGQLRTRKWQDREGNDRYTTEIYIGRFRGEIALLDKLPGNRPPAGSESDYDGPGQRAAAGSAPGGRQGGFADDMDDDVPF